MLGRSGLGNWCLSDAKMPPGHLEIRDESLSHRV